MAQRVRVWKPSPDRKRSAEPDFAEPGSGFGARCPETNTDAADYPVRTPPPSPTFSNHRRSAWMLLSADPSRYKPDRTYGMVTNAAGRSMRLFDG